MKELAKQYDPSQVEDRIYQFWLDGGYFHTCLLYTSPLYILSHPSIHKNPLPGGFLCLLGLFYFLHEVPFKAVQILGLDDALQIQAILPVFFHLHAATLPHGSGKAQLVVGQQQDVYKRQGLVSGMVSTS